MAQETVFATCEGCGLAISYEEQAIENTSGGYVCEVCAEACRLQSVTEFTYELYPEEEKEK